VGCSAPRSPIHEVDAVLAGGRATATTNSCTGNRDKAPRKCSQFLELIGSVAVAVPADYTRYMNQPCVYMGKVGETVKFGWERHPRRGTVGPRKRARWSTHPDVPSPVHPWKMRLPFPNPSPDTGSADPSVHRTGREDRGARAADCISAPREAQCPQRRRAINFGTHKGEGRERRKCSH
jgi:hypothetical protein